MPEIKFITSRREKFIEMQSAFDNLTLVHCPMDLPEMQGIDAERIVIEKTSEGFNRFFDGDFIVDDTSVYFDCLDGKLPGPLIKWFFRALGNQKLYEITRDMRNSRATAITRIGYGEPSGKIQVFKGVMRGLIVPPRGDATYFDWSTIFQPEGHEKTFGEMTQDEKNRISMRRLAAEEFKKFLASRE